MATLLTILLTLSATDVELFETRIRPVLVEHCYKCHSADAAAKKKLKGGLRLDTRAGIRRGGDSGPAVTPGRPEASLILSALRYQELEMPPQGKLPESVIRDFVRWIEAGAADPRDDDPRKDKVNVTPPRSTGSPPANSGRSGLPDNPSLRPRSTRTGRRARSIGSSWPGSSPQDCDRPSRPTPGP